jgi:hypothetical protein
MWARAASFENADFDRLQQMTEGGARDVDPPAGMRRAMVLADRDAGRHVFITFFDSREAIAAAEARFEEMGDEIPEEIRGRRTSIDVYEVVLDEALER